MLRKSAANPKTVKLDSRHTTAYADSISGGVPGVQFYGFRVCCGFSEYPFAGEASFILSPRRFKDVNGVMVEPDRGFKLTFEM